MKSLQTKLLILILCCSLVTGIEVLAVGTFFSMDVLEQDGITIINQEADEKAEEMNNVLHGISQSVDFLARYAQEEMGDPEGLWTDSDKLSDYVEKMREVCLNTAETTEGAVAIYLRFNEDLNVRDIGSMGVLLSKDDVTGEFADVDLTDISQYDPDDTEHVGWYYIPMAAGEAIWLDPYNNKNLDTYMTSYVVPVKYEDQIIALIGMDIETSFFMQKVASLQVYESGYAFIWDEAGDCLYHPLYPDGLDREDFTEDMQMLADLSFQALQKDDSLNYYKWDGVYKTLHSVELENGMIFTISAPVKELFAPILNFAKYSVLFLLVIITISILITIRITKRIVRPVMHLNEAAKKIAGGNLDVKIICETKDEIGVLGQSVQVMADTLKEQIESIRQLAYMDIMTDVWNKTAYRDQVTKLDELIRGGTADFSVVVMDINNLKYVNDNLGHEMGDSMIRDAASIMTRVFGGQEVFRIGGDEFVAILSAVGQQECDKCREKFQTMLAEFNLTERDYEIELHVACGGAVFDAEMDSDYASVFRRADECMYEDKAKQKSHFSIKSLTKSET
jgi:diguanylate cyclase (GGDEF)-like protein